MKKNKKLKELLKKLQESQEPEDALVSISIKTLALLEVNAKDLLSRIPVELHTDIEELIKKMLRSKEITDEFEKTPKKVLSFMSILEIKQCPG